MWLAVLLFVFIVGLFVFLDTKKPQNFPPGPKWFPIIGSAYTISKLRKDLGGYLYLAAAALARNYGPIIGLRVGKDRLVMVVGYDAIKEMLTKEDLDGRPQGPFYETRTWGTRRGLLLTDEEFWQEQRRFVLRHLREFGFGRRTMANLIEVEASAIVDEFTMKVMDNNNNNNNNSKGEIVEMENAFCVYVLNTLWSMLAGIRYSPEDKELIQLQELLTELFANIDMVGAPFSQFPILQHIAPEISGYNQFINIHQKIWVFLKNELDNHKKTFDPESPRDLMDVYLLMLQSPDKKPSYSESQLLAICMDMFMAGSETTSKTLGFCFLYIILYPAVQFKAQEEIDRVVGRDRLPSMDDKPNMPYMEAIVLESVRMFMSRTFGIPHRALKDTTLMDYHIPKDTMVVASFTSALYDKQYWTDPEVFRPERFIDRNGRLSVPEQYIPFGVGKHRCIGQTLARSNIFLFTSSLLQKFNFRVPPGQPPPSTKGVDGCTASPGPFQAFVTLRTNE